MVDSAIRARHLQFPEPDTSGFPTAATPDTFILQDTNDSAGLSSASNWKFQEKEETSDYGIEYFPLENFFSMEN